MDKIIWKPNALFTCSNKQRLFWNDSSSAQDTLQESFAVHYIKSQDSTLSDISIAPTFEVLWLLSCSREFKSLKVGWLNGGTMFIQITNFMKTCKLFPRLLGMDRHKNTNRLYDTIILYNYACPYRISRLKIIGKWKKNQSLHDGMPAWGLWHAQLTKPTFVLEVIYTHSKRNTYTT